MNTMKSELQKVVPFVKLSPAPEPDPKQFARSAYRVAADANEKMEKAKELLEMADNLDSILIKVEKRQDLFNIAARLRITRKLKEIMVEMGRCVRV